MGVVMYVGGVRPGTCARCAVRLWVRGAVVGARCGCGCAVRSCVCGGAVVDKGWQGRARCVRLPEIVL